MRRGILVAVLMVFAACDTKPKPVVQDTATPTKEEVKNETKTMPGPTGTRVTSGSDPLYSDENSTDAHVVGWSVDEDRYVLRVYRLEDEDYAAELSDDGEIEYCKGYINHKGQQFLGALVFQVYDVRDGLEHLQTYLVQASDECTPPEEAKENLERAKKKIAEMGINLDEKGSMAQAKDGNVAIGSGPQGAYEIRYNKDGLSEVDIDDGMSGRISGSHEVVLIHGDKRTPLATRNVDVEYGRSGAGSWTTGLHAVAVSPTGKRIVVIGFEQSGNMRGRRVALFNWGAFTWEGTKLAAR